MYKYILFDADNTLLDFEADERNAFFALMSEKQIECDDVLYEKYAQHNLSLWEKYERREIDKQYILDHRFTDFLKSENISGDGIEFNDRFCYHLSCGGIKVKDVDKVCTALIENGYKLYIVTNGIKFIQDKRFEKAGINKYFESFYISECIGFQKPRAEFFDFVLNDIGDFDRSDYLIVGDSLTSDIKGGKNAGIDTCWFNINNVRNDTDIVSDYTIYSLKELLDILIKT